MLDDFSFAPEKENVLATMAPPWQILIADDEEEVHAVTKVALANVIFIGLFHAEPEEEIDQKEKTHNRNIVRFCHDFSEIRIG